MLTTPLFLLATAQAVAPTFHKDVEPILQRSCQGCHRSGQIGPMPLMTYQEARPWAKAIKAAVSTGKMPPWFADAPRGHFREDWRLSDEERHILTAWADGGAPQGDRKQAPPAKAFHDTWQLGEPDLVAEMPKAFEVPASGTVDYQWVVLPLGLKEDRWVQTIEYLPGDRSVVHHIIAFLRKPGSKWLAAAEAGVPVAKTSTESELGQANGRLGVYVPGTPGYVFPEGYAMKLPAGHDIVLQLHYTPNGKAASDRSRVGFRFAKTPPRMQVMNFDQAKVDIRIPPRTEAAGFQAVGTVRNDFELLTMMPHMHLRGKSMRLRLQRAGTGEEVDLLHVPKYDFGWQLNYSPEKPLPIRAGDKLRLEAVFDNSANNPANPNPDAEVRWGDQSWEEMMVCLVFGARPVESLKADAPPPAGYPTPARD